MEKTTDILDQPRKQRQRSRWLDEERLSRRTPRVRTVITACIGETSVWSRFS